MKRQVKYTISFISIQIIGKFQYISKFQYINEITKIIQIAPKIFFYFILITNLSELHPLLLHIVTHH